MNVSVVIMITFFFEFRFSSGAVALHVASQPRYEFSHVMV